MSGARHELCDSERWHILTCYKLGDSAQRIYDDLQQTWGDQASSYSCVAFWLHCFRDQEHEGSSSLSDQPRAGMPRTATTKQMMDAFFKSNGPVSLVVVEKVLQSLANGMLMCVSRKFSKT